MLGTWNVILLNWHWAVDAGSDALADWAKMEPERAMALLEHVGLLTVKATAKV